MKRTSFFLLSCTWLACIASSAYAVTPPAALSKAFSSKFPDVKNVTWEKENNKEYEAHFTQAGVVMSANFSTQGEWLETESAIAVSELPTPVQQAIQKKYQGASIQSADRIQQSNGKTLYEADLLIGHKKKEVTLNAQGVFVK
jgi:hypothetical protein